MHQLVDKPRSTVNIKTHGLLQAIHAHDKVRIIVHCNTFIIIVIITIVVVVIVVVVVVVVVIVVVVAVVVVVVIVIIVVVVADYSLAHHLNVNVLLSNITFL